MSVDRRVRTMSAMSRGWVLTLLVAVVALALGAIAWTSRSGGGRVPSPALARPSPEPADAHREWLERGDLARELVSVGAPSGPLAATSPSAPAPREGAHASPPRVLRVLVSSRDGLPVRAARVRARTPPWSVSHANTTTDVDGRATLEGVWAGDELEVEHDDFLPATRHLAEPWPDPLAIVLEAGVDVLLGRVVDEQRRTVAQAQVRLFVGDRELQARTDGAGQFRLKCESELALPGALRFEIRADGYCFLGDGLALPVARTDAGQRVELLVHSWAHWIVHVRDATGAPVSGCRARYAWSAQQADRFQFPFAPLAALAGAQSLPADGPILLAEVPPLLPLWVQVTRAGTVLADELVGPSAPGQERSLDIVVASTPAALGSTRFHVVDERGAPLPRARVQLAWAEGGATASNLRALDDSASFEVEPQEHDYEILVAADGFAPLRRSFARDFQSATVVELALAPSTIGFRVRVVRVDGTPVSGVELSIEESGGAFRRFETTALDGRASVLGLDANAHYDLRIGNGMPGAFLPAGGPAELVPDPAFFRGVAPSGQELSITLVPGASVRGRFATRRVADGRVYLGLLDGVAPRPRLVFNLDSGLDAEGRFAFAGLPPGSYCVWSPIVASSSPLAAPLATFELGRGEQLLPLELREP